MYIRIFFLASFNWLVGDTLVFTSNVNTFLAELKNTITFRSSEKMFD